MPYIDTDLLDDNEQSTTQPGTSGPSTSSTSPMTPNQGASGPQAAPQKGSGRFADLSEYLRVNAPQQFGSQVAGKVGGDIDKGEQSLTSAQNEFKSRADANTVQDTNGLIGQVSSSPESVNADEFAGLRDAEYKGPVNLGDTQDLYGQVQGAAGSAVGKANASKTESGRFALLDNYFGRPNYSQGQKSLDNLLVQNDPNSQQAFAQMRDNAKTLQSNVNQSGVELGNYGASAKGTTDATRKAARDAVGIDDAGNLSGTGAIGDLRSGLENFYTQRVDQQKTDSDAIRAALSARDISTLAPEQRSALGLEDVDNTYGVDLGNYFQEGPQFSLGQVATPEQYSRYAALSKLANLENDYLPDASQAGQFDDEALFGYDSQGLKNAVGSAKTANETAKSNAINSTPYTFQTGGVGDIVATAFGDSNYKGMGGSNSLASSLELLNRAKDMLFFSGNISPTYAKQKGAVLDQEIANITNKMNEVNSRYDASANPLKK